MNDFDRIQNALQFIDPSDRETWLRMGMAIKSELADAGFDLWEAWSQQAESFNNKDARDVWKSIRAGGGIGIGTLFHEAKANGWQDDGNHQKPTSEELAERKRIAAERAAKEEAEIARERADTAKKAAAIFRAADEPQADNPYLVRKQVSPVATLREIDADAAASILGYPPKSGGDALAGRLLVVPVKQGDKISTLELIDGTGKKTALAGRGTKAGGYWATERLPDGDGTGLTLLAGEGVATVLTASAATGKPGIAALASGNLEAVAKAMRGRYPQAALVILADLVKATGQPDSHAVAAARSVGGKLAIPDFGDDRPEAATDFNDLAAWCGIEAVTRSIANAGDSPPCAIPSSNNEEETCTYGGGRFEVTERGLYYVGKDKDGNEKPPTWICSKIRVAAMTRDAASGAWGRLLEWHDADEVRHQWAMPLDLLQGDGQDVRRELARLGLFISPTRASRDLLASFLQVWPVQARARCVDRLGWHGAVYVTPDEAVGQQAEIVVFQNAHALDPAFAVSGTAGEWRESVARMAHCNSRLIFALSVAFAGPLAELAGEDSGGFHLRGGSSSGKSTALKCAASVWGDPATYPRLWRATANGLEGLAALHNDGLLILDELSQIDPREAGEAAYLLANGQGKARASRTGAARQSARWRLLFLSAGEESLAALMAKSGKKANAGQEIRLADIDADAGVGMGAFEMLHEHPTPAVLAQALKDAASRFHGAAGAQWLKRIVADRSKLADFLQDGMRQFVEEAAPSDAAGQVLRVARRFALVAVAGELATHYGLTGWNEGDADQACQQCFAAWLEAFGGAGNREERAILAQVRAFFETHGASRFEDVTAQHDQRIINRAGFFRTSEYGTREFLVLPEVFKREVCSGFDMKIGIAALTKAGWLEKGEGNRHTQKPRIPGLGPTRCYVLNGRMWEGEE